MKENLENFEMIDAIKQFLKHDLEHYRRAGQEISHEMKKSPKRYDIINYLLASLNRNCSYLEIGVRNPADCFDKIVASCKYSVDPGVEFEENPVDFKLTSDSFFELLREGRLSISSDIEFDVIFIDGLHLAEQVDRDIKNALDFLKDDGFLVLHDCNPPVYWAARENYNYHSSPAFGAWNGTTWKAFLKARYQGGISACTIDTDWGVGVISKSLELVSPPATKNEFYEYSVLEANRKDQLGLVGFEEFKLLIPGNEEAISFSKPQDQIIDWLSARKISDNEKAFLQEKISEGRGGFSCKFLCVDKDDIENIESDLKSAFIGDEVSCSYEILNSGSISESEFKTLLNSLEEQWVCFVKPGDRLNDSGILMAQIERLDETGLAAISFDELYRMEDGGLGAAFRPVGNLDYLLSFPAGMSRHWLFNRKALLDIGGFNPDLPDAFELDAILRLINKGGLECIGHIPEPLVITPSPVLANVEDERKAILSHLAERGYANAELHAPNPGRYQIRYNHPGQPVVSVVLAAGNNLSALQRCVEGLLGNTSYQNFEILFIEQPNSGVEVKEWLAGLAAMQEPKLRVFASKEKTLSRQYNEVQAQAIGDYLLFLSPTTSVVSEHWLDEMLNHAQRGEVGVVGAKLLTPGGEIAHAGYILGLEGPVGAPFVGDPMDAAGYMQRLQVDQNLSAVGGDCMMVLRELFVQVDGFADGELVDEYLSTDLCLRAREAGFLVVWTPHAQLMLDKEQTALPTAEQQDVMYEKWLPQLARDPAYNPNFSLSMPGGFKLADTQISWRPLDSIRPAPVALVHPADLAGCGHYRVMQPFLAMKGEGLVDGAISTGLMHVTDLERYNPDCIVLQRQIGDARLEAMQRMQKFSRAFKVYELDDYLPNLPLKSVHRKDMPKDILRSLRRGLGFVDRFVVSTPALAEAFAGLHGEIVVRENRLPLSWWDGLQTQRRQGKKPRVGWAGGSSHTGDLELIADVVRDLADEVEWVFFGMCPEALKPYVHEFHGGVAIEEYPAKLASLNLDLGLAPLEHNLFNECKSNLRQLEYGACGIPIICTDIRPYQDGQQAGLPVTLVKNRYKDWVDAIRMHINDLDATAKMADELQTRVKADWMLQGEHLLQWRDAWVGR